jgi:predicted amidohydrolase YtcJ
VWGLVTRRTLSGVQGVEHAITVDEAIGLHTTAAAHFLGEESLRGVLTPGRLADLTAWPVDPRRCSIDQLHGLEPDLTLVGGRVVHSSGQGGAPEM